MKKKMISVVILLLISLFFSTLSNVFAFTDMEKFMTYQLCQETEEETKYVKDKVKKVIDELEIRDLEKHKQIKIVNDWIRENVEYDFTKDDTMRSSYDGLYYGKTVCTGYSMIFYRFMEELEIPCDILPVRILETKGGHALNIVKLDNKWYFVDTTNFNSNSLYFLCGWDTASRLFYISENKYSYVYCIPDLENISKTDYFDKVTENTNQNTNNLTTNISNSVNYTNTTTTYYEKHINSTFHTNGYTSSERFKKDYFVVKYGVGAGCTEGGYIEGDVYQEVKNNGKTTRVKAAANPGYKFIMWNDGKLNPTRYDKNITENTRYWAIFEKI